MLTTTDKKFNRRNPLARLNPRPYPLIMRLTAVRGIGVWSARYIMMRGYGFEDCVPVGDAALERSLMRAFSLQQRPDHQQTESLMARFSPFRTLATFYLWQSLSEVAA